MSFVIPSAAVNNSLTEISYAGCQTILYPNFLFKLLKNNWQIGIWHCSGDFLYG